MKQKVTIILFAVLLCGLSIINILTPDRVFSENENRYLTSLPKLSADTILTGEYTEGFEEYASDQFLYRDYWIGLKTLSEMSLLKNESSGVYFTKDNALIETFQSANEMQFSKNLSYLQIFEKNIQDTYGIAVSTMLVPTASWIYRDNLPSYAPEVNQQQMLSQAEDLLEGFIDVSEQLLHCRDEYIYYRTDHHYTTLGAFYCYQIYQEAAGRTLADISDYQITVLADDFLGTIHSKAGIYLGHPDTIHGMLPVSLPAYQVDYNFGERVTDTIYELSYLDTKDKYAAFLNGNQPFIKITTGQENGKRLLLVKDSFANSFIQFLLEDFQEIYVVDLRYYKSSALQLAGDLAITEVLVLYNLKGFSDDPNLFFLTQ